MDLDANLYARWRARLRPPSLSEGEGASPPERLLQAVWFHQRLRRDALRLADGRSLRVLHPGFWNREAGPDFRGAVLQFDTDPPRAGDVELDLAAAGWRAHGHDRNRNFNNVILHVVWNPGAEGKLPTLPLRNFLDAPIAELDSWLGDTTGEWPPELRGRCSAPLRELPDASLTELLRQAALVRLQGKAAAFTARARTAGWEQALWEGLFAALGYKHNVWPFRRLAELLPPLRTGQAAESPLAWQARLFGLAGLLPHELPARGMDDGYLAELWHLWWRERDAWADRLLPKSLWHFHGLRPANHPLRRLALAAHWLAAGDLGERLAAWLHADESAARKPISLLAVLQAGRDEFWSRHYTLASPRLPKPQPLLGATRATDLAVNVILPWLFARAGAGRGELRRRVEKIYFAWPAAEDNAVLKLARSRLLGARPKFRVNAAAQQGLLQIVRDFCERSNALCEQCPFPDVARAFGGGR